MGEEYHEMELIKTPEDSASLWVSAQCFPQFSLLHNGDIWYKY